jgi:hypothetical protein
MLAVGRFIVGTACIVIERIVRSTRPLIVPPRLVQHALPFRRKGQTAVCNTFLLHCAQTAGYYAETVSYGYADRIRLDVTCSIGAIAAFQG